MPILATVKLRKVNRQTLLLMAVTAVVVAFGFLYNPSGQFSDIRPFYGMRYWDGQHPWPFSEYLPPGATAPIPAIEYPALTGLVIWLLTFLIPSSPNATMLYFYLSSFVHGALFLVLIYLVKRISGSRYAYLLLFTPAVVTSLNRNWDIWVMVPTLVSIYLFDRKRYQASAIILGIAIATKFFPAILLLGVAVYFLRQSDVKNLFRYFTVTILVWLGINVPVMAVDFEGWSFFYRLSFTRGLGEGSFFTLFSKMGLNIEFGNFLYYLLNIVTFLSLLLYLWKIPKAPELIHSSFLLVAAFTLFGKQYSMQYVLWLAPLALIAAANVAKKSQTKLIYGYLIWQTFEMIFHQAYYQNLLARVLESRGTPLVEFWSDAEYGVAGVFRYSAFLLFLFFLINAQIEDQRRIGTKRRSQVKSRHKGRHR